VLSAVIIVVYIISLMHFCDGNVFQSDIDKLDGFENKLMDARTVAFISLVWSENIRSYTSRSFNKPVWHDVLGNVQMQKAIILAQICLYVAVLVPFFSTDILQLRGLAVGVFGWVLALVGPFGCLVLCEACKLITAYQMNQYQEMLAAKHDAEDRRLEAAAAERKVSGAELVKGNSQKQVSNAMTVVPGGASGGGDGHLVKKINGKFVGTIDGAIIMDPESGTDFAGGSGGKTKQQNLFTYGICSCFGIFPKMQYGVGASRG
jgi:hypothetical protein